MNNVLEYASPSLLGRGRTAIGRVWQTASLVLIYLAIFAACSLLVDNFASARNFSGLLLSVSTLGMVACTMMFCLAAGDFDLSVGSMVAVAGVVAAQVVNHAHEHQWPVAVPLAVLAGVGTGLVFGIINGLNIAVGGINALIATLATMQVARGLAYLLCTPIGVPVGVRDPAFYVLGTPVSGIDKPVLMMAGAFVVFGFLLNYTIYGRNALAIGGNIESARLAGVRVRLCKVVIFALQGAVCGFAGAVLASRLTSAQPSTSQGLELQAISACVLGGVSLTGGLASISGVIVGVLIIGTLQNVMNLLNVNNFFQYLVSGGVLILAVYVDRLKNRRG